MLDDQLSDSGKIGPLSPLVFASDSYTTKFSSRQYIVHFTYQERIIIIILLSPYTILKIIIMLAIWVFSYWVL